MTFVEKELNSAPIDLMFIHEIRQFHNIRKGEGCSLELAHILCWQAVTVSIPPPTIS